LGGIAKVFTGTLPDRSWLPPVPGRGSWGSPGHHTHGVTEKKNGVGGGRGEARD